MIEFLRIYPSTVSTILNISLLKKSGTTILLTFATQKY